MNHLLPTLIVATLLSGCATVRPGEGAVRFSALSRGDSTKVVGPGLYRDGMFRNHVVYDLRWQTHIEELEVQTEDKLHMSIAASITYRIREETLLEFDRTLGKSAYKTVIKPVLLTAIRTEFAEHTQDVVVPQAGTIQKDIAARARDELLDLGIEVSRVVLDDIDYPEGIADAIARQMATLQEIETQRADLELVLRKSEVAEERARGVARVQLAAAKAELEVAKQEAAVAMIRAKTDSDSIRSLAKGLSPSYLRLRAIEAAEKLATSPNAKIYVLPQGKGGLPMMFHPEE